jgi:hypothetical protein
LEGADDALDVGVEADGEFDGFEATMACGVDHEIRDVAEIARLALSASFHSVDNGLNFALWNALIHL